MANWTSKIVGLCVGLVVGKLYRSEKTDRSVQILSGLISSWSRRFCCRSLPIGQLPTVRLVT